MSSSGYHPNIGSIIRVRDQLFKTLYIDDNIPAFLSQAKGLMALLKPVDQDTAFKETIDKEIKFFASNNSRKRRNDHLSSYRKKYDEWFMTLNAILWDKNYLENETYGMRYPDQMSKDQAYKSPLL